MRAIGPIFAALFLAGCSSVPSQGDLAIIYNEYVFPDHSRGNPYSSDEIGQVNTYIKERLEFYRVENVAEVYLVPTPYSNRLVFVSTCSGDEPSKELRGKIAKDVEGFLDSILRTRPWNKKSEIK